MRLALSSDAPSSGSHLYLQSQICTPLPRTQLSLPLGCLLHPRQPALHTSLEAHCHPIRGLLSPKTIKGLLPLETTSYTCSPRVKLPGRQIPETTIRLKASMRTELRKARAIGNYQNPALLLQQALHILRYLKRKTMTLNRILWRL
jgi:hypothetical protein